MLVVAPTSDRVFWLPDRHSALEGTGHTARVILTGDNRRMLAAYADRHERIDLSVAVSYDGPALSRDSPEGAGYAVLTNERTAYQVLFPPYIADALKRPDAPHLRDPECTLHAGAVLMVHHSRRAVVWAQDSYDFTYFAYAAPILPSGSVDWENADEIDRWPVSYRQDLQPLADDLVAELRTDEDRW
ncbi:hypothetical protein [Nonomuraea sp. NPDC049400]|uniref:hypothetical protein n=1 Tax=Nonomuraea sp. NPDC049400 TaxID=3364352 RepID=UPI0037AD6EA8